MNTKDLIERILQRHEGFPNVSETAKYEFLSQTVYINSVEISDIDQYSKSKDLIQLRKFYSLVAHEATHWLDHVSTLWGKRFLIEIFNAFTARRCEMVDELWRAQSLHMTIKRNSLSRYYTIAGQAASEPWDGHPWSYQTTCGLYFDRTGKPSNSHPFIAFHFFNAKGEFIKRVPLSIVSLLETNAIASEIAVQKAFIGMLDEDARLIESSLLQNQFLDSLYNPELTVYSVAAHCFANLNNCRDIYKAYRRASKLSTLCLNFPSNLFPLLEIPDEFRAESPDLTQSVSDRATQMLSSKDLGFVFYILALHSPKDEEIEDDEWLQKTLEASGLPLLEDFHKLVLEESDSISKEILIEPSLQKLFDLGLPEDKFVENEPNIAKLLSIGTRNLNLRGISGNPELLLKSILSLDESKARLQLPPILLGDDNIIQLGIPAMNLTSEQYFNWIEYIWDIESRLSEFHDACII